MSIPNFVWILLASLLSYGGHLSGEFAFDDTVAIKKNADVFNRSSPILDLFRHDFWGVNLSDDISHKSYRPLTVLTFRLEHHLYGSLLPSHMKKLNFALHVLCSWLVWRLLERLIDGRVAMLTALLFTVHPIHTEAVSGIVGRAELLTAAFFLLALIVHMSGVRGSSLLVVLATALGTLCKETGIMIAPACVVLDTVVNSNLVPALQTFGRSSERVQLPRRIRASLALTTATIGILYLRLRLIDFKAPSFKPMDNPLAAQNETVTRVLTQNYLYALSFWLLLCPDWLCFDWALGTVPLVKFPSLDPRILATVAFGTLLAALVILGNRNVIIALSLMIVPYIPASGIIKLGFVIAERVLYLPSIGFLLLVSLGFHRLERTYKRHRDLLRLFLVSHLLISAARCRLRAAEWANEEVLFRSALRVCGNNAKVHYNIARLAADRADKTTAFQFYQSAIDLYPNYESALMNLGNLYREIHDYETAERFLKRSIAALEAFPSAWMNLGIVQAATKNYRDALASYHTALRHRPHYPNCLYNLGNLYIDMDNSTMALRYWQETIRMEPTHRKAWANIFAWLDSRGRNEEIIAESEKALRHLPDDSAILFSRANAFGKMNEFEESERLFKRAIASKPDFALYHANLGVLYHRWNKTDAALASYRRALELDPKLKNAQRNIKSLMQKIGANKR